MSGEFSDSVKRAKSLRNSEITVSGLLLQEQRENSGKQLQLSCIHNHRNRLSAGAA